MHQNWKKVILGIFVVGLLIVSFWYGGNAPGLQVFSDNPTENMVSENMQPASDERNSVVNDTAGTEVEKATTEEPQNIIQQIMMNVKLKKKNAASSNKTQNSKQAQKNANQSVEKQEKKNKKSKKKSNKKKSSTKTESTTQKKKKTTESNNQQENTTGVTTESSIIENTTEQEEIRKDTVTISISCAILLEQMDLLKESKRKYVPKDGVILGETEVEIEDGDTAFDVLQKVTKSKKIHLEYSYTPAYKSHYIEGIHNIYEFDAGNLSGWMYCVNDEFTGVGCSFYEVEDGDVIRWLYSCELGKDIGNYFEE